MTTLPTADDAKDLAARYGAAGVVIVARTADGRAAYAHHGLTREFGPPAGWVYDGAVRTAERLLGAANEGKVGLEDLDALATGAGYVVED